MKTCPKCGGNLVARPGMFAWRGAFFTGLVCEPCNALWDNPDDSFLEAVKKTPLVEE